MKESEMNGWIKTLNNKIQSFEIDYIVERTFDKKVSVFVLKINKIIALSVETIILNHNFLTRMRDQF